MMIKRKFNKLHPEKVNPKNFKQFAGYHSCRINRQTKSIISIVNGEKQGLDTTYGRWYTICEDHGAAIPHETLGLAKAHASHPENWCDRCLKKDLIKIVDWAGNILYEGRYDSPDVDKVLDANRCPCDYKENCPECGETGYKGDFEIYWIDEDRIDNVYEFINY